MFNQLTFIYTIELLINYVEFASQNKGIYGYFAIT